MARVLKQRWQAVKWLFVKCGRGIINDFQMPPRLHPLISSKMWSGCQLAGRQQRDERLTPAMRRHRWAEIELQIFPLFIIVCFLHKFIDNRMPQGKGTQFESKWRIFLSFFKSQNFTSSVMINGPMLTFVSLTAQSFMNTYYAYYFNR